MKPYEDIVGVLKANSISYKELDHEPVYTSEQAATIRGFSLDSGAKSLLLKADNKFVLTVLSGSKRLDSKKLKKTLGVKNLRFATPEEVKENMGCEVGACYPFGSIIQLDTYLDDSLTKQTDISFNPGLHNKSLVIKLSDYLMIENPKKVNVAVS